MMTETNFNRADGVSLEKYFDRRLDDMEKSLYVQIAAMEAKLKFSIFSVCVLGC